MSLIAKIKALRLQKGLTQQELAHKANMCLNNFNRIESGNRNEKNLTIKNLQQIADALEMDLKIDFIEKFDCSTHNNDSLLIQKEAEILLLKNLVQSLQINQECAQHYLDLAIQFNLMYLDQSLSKQQQKDLFTEAKKFYLKALSIQPNFYEAFCYLGHLSLRKARKIVLQNMSPLEFQAEYQLAEYFYSKAQEINPNHHRTINNQVNLILTEAFFLKKNYPEKAKTKLLNCLVILEKASKKFPQYKSMFIYNFACIHANLGNTHYAIKLLEEIYHDDSNYQPREKDLIILDEDLFILHKEKSFSDWLESKF